MASDILIVDDEADIRELVAGILQDEGHGARTARDSDDALAAVVARRPNLVFLDIWLQGSRLDGPDAGQLRVAFQGSAHSFSDAAARKHLATQGAAGEPVGYGTLREVAAALLAGGTWAFLRAARAAGQAYGDALAAALARTGTS